MKHVKVETIGNATLYLMDCMEYMAGCKDKEFDLAIVDPPYGIGEDGSRNASRGKLAIAQDYKPYSGNDKTPPPPEYFAELFRVAKNQIMWGANHYVDLIGRRSPCWIVWDKENGGNDFADCELAYTSFDSAVRKYKFQWKGMLQGDMKNKEARIHPNQKPVKLYEWLLTNYAKPGQRILDTHLGSGSSAIACNNMGYEIVGMEIDEDYYNSACERITQAQKQIRLFE
jgi:site-specific DNA-methyltransferase (adenine-specific)